MKTTTILNTDSFAPHSQQALVLSLFEGLKEGGSFVVQSHTDPKALCAQLDALKHPSLHWEFAEKSQSQWKIRISKKENAHTRGGCCGVCGG